MSEPTCRLLAAVVGVLLFAAPARADVLHLKDGKQIEGRVLSETAATVEIQTKFGKLTIEKIKLQRIEYQRLPREELQHRIDEAGEDAVRLYDVARFALEHKFTQEYRELLRKVVELDPSHGLANEELGNLFYDGKWHTPEGLEAYKQAEVERMTAQGKVLYQGRWVDEEYAKKSEGFELYKGQWLRWKEIYRLQAEELMPELLGTTLEIRDSEHFTLRSALDPDVQQAVLDVLEDGYAHFVGIYRPDEMERRMMDFYPVAVYVLPESSLIEKFVAGDGYMVRMYNPPKGIHERYVDANSFAVFFPRPLIVTSEGRHLKGGDSRVASLLGFLTHFEGALLLRRFKRGGLIPGFVESGVSHYYEGLLNGHRTVTVIEYTGFESVQKWEKGLENFQRWYESLADAEFRASLPRLEQLRATPVEELDARALVKSYFVVRWLMEEKPEQFVTYVREAFREHPISRAQVSEEEAFLAAFGEAGARLDEEFEAWAAKQPPVPPL